MNHQQVQEQLPWISNETLSAEDLQAALAHAEDCPECGSDLVLLAALRAVTVRRSPDEPVFRPVLIDQFMAELPPQAVAPGTQSTAQPSAGAALWDTLKAVPRALGVWLGSLSPRLALAGQFAAVAMVAVLATVMVSSDTRDGTPTERSYETVSGTLSGDFTVAFAPAASEAEIRNLLLAAGLRLVDGPSGLGIYRIARTDARTDDRAEAQLREQLMASGLVTYLQPVVAP
jgi:hypothetical protein